ncbi:MAG: hypothetical protein WAX69_27120 [Victivallales bacterium]
MAGKTIIECSKCQYQYEVEDKFLGKLLSCPKCHVKFYAQTSNRNIQETIKTSASVTARMKAGNIQSKTTGKSKKRLFTALAAIPLALLIAFLLWESLNFLQNNTNEKPNPALAFSASQELLRSRSGIENINEAIFSKKYNLGVKDQKKKTFTIRTSVTMMKPDQKKPSENRISINMQYLGDEQWEFIDYSFD